MEIVINYLVNYFTTLTELEKVSWISLILFNVALLPDMYKLIKAKMFVGSSIFSNVIFIIALMTGFYSNYHHHNYVFCINDVVSIILQFIILGLKLRYNK